MQFDRDPAAGPGSLPPPSARPAGVVKKALAIVVAAALFVLAMMASVVLFAVVLTAGAVLWGYLWWKTRAARKAMAERMAEAQAWQQRQQQGSSGASGLVLEGEVIREIRPGDEDRR